MTTYQNRPERANAIKNLVTGFLGGLIIGALPVLLILITIEPATPNGVNIMFGELGGYHIATTTTESN
jgi:hypothetical protein